MDGRRARRMTNHQNILAVARVMIDEGGLENLSIRALAEKVGVSVTTLYNLFDTREAIVRAALDQVLAEITPIVGSLEPNMSRGQICQSAVSISNVAFQAMTPSLLLAVMSDDANPREFFIEHHASDGIAPFLRRAQIQGELSSDADLAEITTTFEAVIYSASRFWAMGLINTDERTRRIHIGVKLALLAYATPQGRQSLTE